MDQFAVRDGELVVGGLSLSELAAHAGGTPFFAYDRALLDARMRELRETLPARIELHYAIKANPHPELVRHLAARVDGLDVASGGELALALQAGCSAAAISFAGPGKSRDELEAAVAAGVLLNIESHREARELADIAARGGRAARVAVRVNPDFELKSSGMRMGGGAKPFGVDAEAVPALLGEINRMGLAFEGFHIFAGSQNLRADAIVEAQRLSFELAVRLAEHASAPVRVLNLGGGFGIPYFPGDSRLDLAPIADNLATLLDEADTRLPGASLALELGRYLVGEAGVYVCRVVDRKESRGQVFLVCDGGLNHHLAASGNFGQVIRKNFPVAIGNRMDAPRTLVANVVGPLCTPLDVLAERMTLADAQPGDLVVVFQSGAYGATASPQAFLGHPAPVEMLVG
ncbi:pyridoxal-dependent decarboxylase, exosortase A system-associated [Pseudazoarcus pumilus]|uniref:Pyridoxal-dependent decarboxylase, exosortase A system-associated n=2 Tax=Pseudazoarcus pumilus TaxID=2067960 RepID=A0A2I6S4Q9_9RHOO|nr:pyridoxal-dependent decarboxylase, exosortase A system-associated [Pseudazoarcus pumilus]